MLIWLPLRQSRWLTVLRCLQYGCAALAVWHVDWPFAFQIVVLLLIAAHGWRQTPLPKALLLDQNGLQLIYGQRRVPARLAAQCYCSECLLVLRVVLEPEQHEETQGRALGRQCCLVLLPDSSTRDALRRLRVYLRWHARVPTD